MRKIIATLAAAGTLAIASPAAAATVTFDTGGTTNNASSKTFTGNNGTTVRVTAMSIDSTGKIVLSPLGQFSGNGLGIQNGNGDNSHTVDNSPTGGWRDFLVFSFSQNVQVDTATFNTNYNFNDNTCCLRDTDATIGAGAFNQAWVNSLVGQNQSALNALGLYSSNSTATTSSTRDINPLDRSGTLWLVGASFNNTDKIADGFKFKQLTYTVAPPPVPEPSTWALLILGFGGVGAAMRKRKQQALAFA